MLENNAATGTIMPVRNTSGGDGTPPIPPVGSSGGSAVIPHGGDILTNAFIDGRIWQQMKSSAETFFNSGALPQSINNVAKVIMVFQAGYEAGLKPLESLNSFYFVNGRLAMFGDIAIALVKRAGHKVEWGICNDKTATVTITRCDDKQSMSNTFTMDQAKARKLDMGSNGIKDVWVKHPENMLKFKVFHMTAKFICPDALHGTPIKEVVEAEANEVVEEDKKGAITTTRTDSKPSKPETSLEAALEAKDEPKNADTPKKPTKTVVEANLEPKVVPEAEDREPTYEELIEKELSGEKLTNAEKMLLGKLKTKRDNAK